MFKKELKFRVNLIYKYKLLTVLFLKTKEFIPWLFYVADLNSC